MLATLEGIQFTTGFARYFDAPPDAEQPAKIFVKIRAGELPAVLFAELDTGAAYCVLNNELARELDIVSDDDPRIMLSTRLGTITGQLTRAKITILADDGQSLEVEAMIFVSTDWPGGNFLGYSGFLDKIRFAIDPQNNSFHFGSCE